TDSELARTLREQSAPAPETASAELPPDHQAKTLEQVKRRIFRRSPLRILALGFTGLAGARLVEQTNFTRSPVEVVALSVIAVLLWVLYGWHTRRLQRVG